MYFQETIHEYIYLYYKRNFFYYFHGKHKEVGIVNV
jgi:hypothetical protein